MKLFAPFALAVVFAASASAQSTFTDPANLRGERVAPLTGRELPIDKSEALGGRGLEQLLRKLNTRASLMLIVAHPDDEDGGMLTFYSRGMGARVGMLTLNRGEGGQNLMTGDFEDALGLLRTQELLAADRYFAADQFFGTEVDFGFSKTKEEAFAKWTHERVLYDAVRAVRLYRPLVIASVFIGGVTDGHGQHQVSGQIAQEVFKAAGDPNVFPELTKEGILPWQPLKVYARVPMQAITPQGLFDYATGRYEPAKFTNYVTGEVTTTTPSVDVTVHEGKIDPILGPHRAVEDFVSYVQFARQGLGLQKSQIGAGVRVPPPGAFDISYHRYGSKLPPSRQKMQEDSFFDGIDTTLAGIATLAPTAFPALHASLAKIQADVNVAIDHLDPTNLAKSAPMLADALKECEQLIAEVNSASLPNEAKQNVLHELNIKHVQLGEALALALNIQVKATTQAADNVARSTPSVRIEVTSGVDKDVSLFLVAVSTTPKAGDLMGEVYACMPPGEPQPGGSLTPKPFHSPMTRTCTLPSRMTEDITRPYFHRSNVETPVYTLDRTDLRGAPATPPALRAEVSLEYRQASFVVDTVITASGQPVQIVPPVSLTLSSNAQVLPNTASDFTFTESIQPANVPLREATIKVRPTWTVHGTAASGADNTAVFRVEVPPNAHTPTTVTASATIADQAITEGYRPVGYSDLPRTNYFTPATNRIVPVDLKFSAKHNIAYLPGTGDAVPEALASIGLKPVTLTLADLTAAKLAQYDTVILGVRTYAAHADLHGAPTQALLDYARNGGNVVVQYQTGEFTAADAPYPLAVGNQAERVIDETDPVKLLGLCDNIKPDHSCERSEMGQTGTLNGSVSDYALLTTPNKITPADFDNWIEERGHGFLRTWDDHYTALTETHDPGDPPQRGGLVTTQLGKGRWTYCAYALYRQLPEAVPGAFRLFVNLINP